MERKLNWGDCVKHIYIQLPETDLGFDVGGYRLWRRSKWKWCAVRNVPDFLQKQHNPVSRWITQGHFIMTSLWKRGKELKSFSIRFNNLPVLHIRHSDTKTYFPMFKIWLLKWENYRNIIYRASITELYRAQLAMFIPRTARNPNHSKCFGLLGI